MLEHEIKKKVLTIGNRKVKWSLSASCAKPLCLKAM